MELLRSWVNDELKLSRSVSSFEVDMANGYLIGEILVRHGLLPGHAPLDSLLDKESPNAKISNFGLVQQALLDLGVKFDSQIANSIMTEKKGVATNLCYQLRLGLQNAKGAGKPVTRRGVAEPVLMGSTIKANRMPLSKFETMQSEHFDTLVRQAADDPKELSQAVNLSRFTDHMLTQQHESEEMDQLRHEQQLAHVQQRRQLQLSKTREGQRLMDEWQSEGYGKHALNQSRRRDAEKSQLRFELVTRDKRLRSQAASTAKSMLELSTGIEGFEQTMRRLASDGGGGEDDGEGKVLTTKSSPAEHLGKLERLLPAPAAMELEARTYMEKLKGRRVEEQASRKEREVRRRKLMLEQAQAQAQLEERRRDELLLTKLSRQCEEERKLSQQLWQAKQEKAVMRDNRLLREQQYEERRERDDDERRARNRELNARSAAEYHHQRGLERQRAAEADASRQAVKRQKHEATCRAIAEQLVALSGRVTDVRASAQPLLPPKVLRDWFTLFVAGVPLTRVSIDTPHASEEPFPAEEAPEELLHEQEVDAYLIAQADWGAATLAKQTVPEEVLEMAEHSLAEQAELTPTAAEGGCALVGRMVLDLIDVTMPPPPPRPPPVVGPSLTKLAIAGKPFSGKSLLAQQLAEQHNLRVLMPQEITQLAVKAAMRSRAAGEPEPEEGSAAALGSRAAAILQEGGTLPDEVTVPLLVEAIRGIDPVSYSGFVLDGFPRTAAQAKMLEKALTGYAPVDAAAAGKAKGSKVAPPPEAEPPPAEVHVPGLDLILRLDLDDEMVRRRALGRRLDPETGTVYHVEFEPPPEAEDVNERLVPLLGASNQEAQLQPSLTAYKEGEAELAEWFTSLSLLQPLPAEGTIAEVQESAMEQVAALIVRQKEAAILAEAAAVEAAAVAAAEAAAAAEAEAEAAATAAAAEAEAARLAETGEEPPEPEPEAEGEAGAEVEAAVAAPAPPLAPDAAGALLGQWKALEADFLSRARGCLGRLREAQWLLLQRVTANRAEFVALLRAPDARQLEVAQAQGRFNAVPPELRLQEAGKAELHMVVEEMQERLWGLGDEKREAAEALLHAMAEDEWLSHHAHRVLLALLELAQAEADRYVNTMGLLADYCSLRCTDPLPFPHGKPELYEVALPEGCALSVPLVFASGGKGGEAAAAAPPAKGGKADAKGGKPDKGGKGAPPSSSEPPEPLLLTALTAVAAAYPEPPAEEAPAAEEGAPPPSADELRMAEWANYLASAATGERAKLRRRLAALSRFGCGMLGGVRGGTADLYAQLDAWLGDRLKEESEAGAALVRIMRTAVEDEEPLPHDLQLEGSTLVIDEALLLLPPPPPPPPPPLEQRQQDNAFTVAQLGALVAKLKDASTGPSLSVAALGALLSRLCAAGFDAAQPLVPPMWQPLGPPAYERIAALYGDTTVGWPEVAVALSGVRMPSEAELVALMIAGAKAAGRPELLPGHAPPAPPPAEEGAEAAAADAEVPAAPPPAPLVLSREQWSAVELWFESSQAEAAAAEEEGLGQEGQEGEAYPVAAKLKELLFEMLAAEEGLDLRQLLLYCCDSPAKAFALIGHQTQGMLSLEQLHALLHREGAEDEALGLPTHADPFSREALLRLFAELKLDQAERLSYGLVATHPLGQALLEQCSSYTPKGVYALVAELQAQAGSALKM